MLPNYSKCCWFVHGQGIADEEFNPFDSRAWSRFSFYDELFSHAPDKAFLDFQLKRAWRLHRDVLSASLPAPHDTTQRLIVTGWIKTITRVLIDSHTGGRLPFIRNDGDGTVPLHSAAEGREVDDKLLHYSPGEHMQIFNQTAALEIVKRTLTGGTSPVGGNTPNLTIVTNDRRIDVKSLQYKIAPGAVHPDETLSLTIRLVGEDGLAQADLSGITAAFEGESGATELTLRRDAEMQNHSDRVTLISEFLAPKIPGAYIVRIHIPGFAEDYKDVFLVAAN
jgi:hypothetical protein